MVTSSDRTYLTKLLEKGNEDPKATLMHVQTLVQQYPYFQALHHLGWQIADKHLQDQAPALLHSCAVHTKNRLHLIPTPGNQEEENIVLAQNIDAADEVMSFVDWLHQIDGSVSNESNQDRLIDKFIATSPKITALKTKTEKKDLTKKQDFDDKSLMTETLAEVYLKQGKFKNAINAYEILALKYPEKSGFFADQIKKIKKAQNHS